MKECTDSNDRIESYRLTSTRGEKIAAVEGLALTPRMRVLLEMSKDLTGDERRQLIREQFQPQRRRMPLLLPEAAS